MRSGIPEGTYELKIGDSFLNSAGSNRSNNRMEFNTLRFDFKPASISAGSEAYIAESQNENGFQVIVPGEGQKPTTIFKGAKKVVKGDKECLLIYDETTKELCLERVSANINVKKTREAELDKKVRKEVDKLRKANNKTALKSKEEMPKIEDKKPVEKTRKEHLRTISGSSAGEAEENEEDEENVSALEQLMTSKPSKGSVEENSPPKKMADESSSKAQQQQNAVAFPPKQPSPAKKTASFVKKSILAEDLQLSESSSEEEDDEMEDY